MKPPYSVDLETTSTDPEKGSVMSCSVSDGSHTVAWSVVSPGDLRATKTVLDGSSPTIIHWVPMESSWSERFLGNPRHTNFMDTALMAFRLAPGEPMKLASVVARELPEFSGWKGSTEEQLADPETGRSMLGVDTKSLLERNALDAYLTWHLKEKLWPRLTPEEQSLHREDVSIAMFVDRMSRRGMLVSEEALIELRRVCLDTMERERLWLRSYTGVTELNPGSTEQLAEVFRSRGMRVLPKRMWQESALAGEPCLPETDTGGVSTAGAPLKLLRANTDDPRTREFVDHILAYRKAQDRVGDNVTAYAQARDPGDGRIRHGFFWPGTVSWRPSCFAPNRLNVPREGVRQLFTAPPGYVFFEMDLSQAELRIMAQLSGDPVLVRGFREKVDFHRRMGGRVYNKMDSLGSVTKNERYVGKKGNFSCGYFIGDMALWEAFAKEDMILPFSDVQRLRYAFWYLEYERLRKWSEEERRKVRSGEYLTAPTGAYRWNLEQAKLIHPRDENEAINSVYNWRIQAVPPRLVYRMGLLLEERIPETCLQIVNSVYDCLMGYIREDVVMDVVREIERVRVEVMGNEDSWLKVVEIPCDMKVGSSWGNLKEVAA